MHVVNSERLMLPSPGNPLQSFSSFCGPASLVTGVRVVTDTLICSTISLILGIWIASLRLTLPR